MKKWGTISLFDPFPITLCKPVPHNYLRMPRVFLDLTSSLSPSSPPSQAKKHYERASEEAENAQNALEKADNDPNSTKAKIDKVCILLKCSFN